jgi:hypothetical protein
MGGLVAYDEAAGHSIDLYVKTRAGLDGACRLHAGAPTGKNVNISLSVGNSDASDMAFSLNRTAADVYYAILDYGYLVTNDDIRVGKGLWVGSTTDDPDEDDVHIDGSINKSTALGARVYNDANISINNDTTTTLTYNSERFDDDTIHSTASNTGRLTCVHAGTYLITANVCFAANATGCRMVLFLLNGATEIARHRVSAASAGATVLSLTTTYKLAATDYVQCRGYQNSGGALNVEYQANYSPTFGMVRIA